MTTTHAHQVTNGGPSPEGEQRDRPPTHRGDPTARRDASEQRMADREDLEKRIKFELLAFKGCLLTAQVREIVGPSIWLEAPRLTPRAIFGALSVDGVRGQLITEALAEGRARALARLATP